MEFEEFRLIDKYKPKYNKNLLPNKHILDRLGYTSENIIRERLKSIGRYDITNVLKRLLNKIPAKLCEKHFYYRKKDIAQVLQSKYELDFIL